MGIFNRKPRVKTMARAGDADGLIAASRYRELSSVHDDGVVDLGTRTRVAAIYALRDLGPTVGQEAVIEALADPEDRVRTAAIVVLFERSEPEPIADGLRWFPREGNSRYLATRALLELGVTGSAGMAADALVHQLPEEPIADDDIAAFEQLFANEPEGARDEVIGLLTEAIRDDDDFVANRAVQLLVRLAPASVEVLLDALPDPDAGHHAAVGLTEIKDSRALKPLIEALDHADARARAASCVALGELRDSTAVEPLLRASQDPELAVRARAGAALDRLGTVAVVVGISALLRPEIENALESGRGVEPQRLRAAKALPNPHNGRTVAGGTTLERVARLLEGLGAPARRASADS